MEVGEVFSDEELTALALAADPKSVPDVDAVPWASPSGSTSATGGLLPAWYMPAPMAGGRRLQGWRRWVAIVIVVAFLAIDAYGLCSTYGQVVLA